MKNNNIISFQSTKPYNFGLDHKTGCCHMTEEEQQILKQVIAYAGDSLMSRFSDFVYLNEDRPHYKLVLKGQNLSAYRKMVDRYKLSAADIPEFMEDMIRPETFISAVPKDIRKNKKDQRSRTEARTLKDNWIGETDPAFDGRTIFTFKDMISFMKDEPAVPVTLKFSLKKVIRGMYEMTVHAFGID